MEERDGTTRVSFHNLRITDSDLKLLKHLPDVTDLELSGTPVTDAGMVHLKELVHLRSLSLFETAISDDGAEHFKNLKKLNFLLLKRTDVTDDGAKMLRNALPNCETISVSPRTPVIALPVGKWTVTFSNGVQQTCEIRADGTASVVEPLRRSEGKVFIQGRTAKLKFADDRTERWTPVGTRMVVQHHVGGDTANAVLGIAEKAAP